MCIRTFVLSVIAICLFGCGQGPNPKAHKFNIEHDLLLVFFDSKTDVDDIHTIAGVATIMSHPNFDALNVHAVAGTYGIQSGLYVPSNDLFEMVFDERWSDAHADKTVALNEVSELVLSALKRGGRVWIAEAGQSDFSAELIRKLGQLLPKEDLKSQLTIVQHSDWNEENTTEADLKFVKKAANYQRIPDGNIVGNGTPGFVSETNTLPTQRLSNDKLHKIWSKAIDIATHFNGLEGRYNNPHVAKGGLDFSDLAEVCWILECDDLKDTHAFFERFVD